MENRWNDIWLGIIEVAVEKRIPRNTASIWPQIPDGLLWDRSRVDVRAWEDWMGLYNHETNKCADNTKYDYVWAKCNAIHHKMRTTDHNLPTCFDYYRSFRQLKCSVKHIILFTVSITDVVLKDYRQQSYNVAGMTGVCCGDGNKETVL
jgi:hypothetical protein